MRSRRSPRGAAVTELALAMVFIVPLALLTLWLGDLYHVVAKLQEQAIRGTWAMTRYLRHDTGSGTPNGTAGFDIERPAEQVIASARRATARPLDYAGLMLGATDTADGEGFTCEPCTTGQSGSMTGACQVFHSLLYPSLQATFSANKTTLFSCNASASVSRRLMPLAVQLLDERAPLAADIVSLRAFPSGNGLTVLLDDQALEDGRFCAAGSGNASCAMRCTVADDPSSCQPSLATRAAGANLAYLRQVSNTDSFTKPASMAVEERLWPDVFGVGAKPNAADQLVAAPLDQEPSNTMRLSYAPPSTPSQTCSIDDSGGAGPRCAAGAGSGRLMPYHPSSWDEDSEFANARDTEVGMSGTFDDSPLRHSAGGANLQRPRISALVHAGRALQGMDSFLDDLVDMPPPKNCGSGRCL